MEKNKVYLGDSLETIKTFPDKSIDCVVTSPPYYGLRDYGVDGQIGLEETPEEYIDKLVSLFREIRRCLKDEGTCWVNLGDSYSGNCSRTSKGRAGMGAEREGVFTKGGGLPPKNLIGIPWRFAFAMQADGWILRQDIIWHKPNPMPESVTDRCTKAHEYIFLFSKQEKYYFDAQSIQEECVDKAYSNRQNAGEKERSQTQGYSKAGGHRDNSGGFTKKSKNTQYDGQTPNSTHLRREAGLKDVVYTTRNKRDVWSVCVKPNKEAHFATYPPELITPCILAGCPEQGIVLDPFMGSGTTGIVARTFNRNYVGCELNPEYHKMSERRIWNEGENLFRL